jgi:hypothetical protein
LAHPVWNTVKIIKSGIQNSITSFLFCQSFRVLKVEKSGKGNGGSHRGENAASDGENQSIREKTGGIRKHSGLKSKISWENKQILKNH